MLYFETLEQFLNNSHRILVLHEENRNNEKEEVYFVLLPKKYIKESVSDIFNIISIKSSPSMEDLSLSTQKYILENDVWYIHLTTAIKNSPMDIKKDVKELKDNMAELLKIVYPEVNDRLRVEQTQQKAYVNKSQKVEVEDNSDEDLLSYVQKNSAEILNSMAEDTQQVINKTKTFLNGAKNDLQPDIEKSVEQLKNNLPVIKEKIQNGSGAFFSSVSKGLKAIRKMK